MQDTFVIVGAKLDGLRRSDLLKSWLFAVARDECHRRLRARPGAVIGIETGEVMDDTIDFGIDLERAQLTEVVSAAMAALPLAKREAIELSLRQDFDSYDLASTLGISRHRRRYSPRTPAGSSRSRSRRYSSPTRRGACTATSWTSCSMVADDRLTATACHEIVRHVHHCRTCSKRVRRDLQLATLLGVLPATEIARAGLRRQVLSVVASDAPDVVAYRADVVRGAEPFDESSGFPLPLDRPRREHRLRRPAVLALAATGAIAVRALRGRARDRPASPAPAEQQLAASPSGGRRVRRRRR